MPVAIALFLMLMSASASGQRSAYIRHNLLEDRAALLAAHREHVAAAACYDSALALIPWDCPLYFEAVSVHLRAQDPSGANRILGQGVQYGFGPELFKDDSLLAAHLESEASLPFRRSWPADRAVFVAKADTALIHELETMVKLDQAVRTGMDSLMQRIDSLNFEQLLAICTRSGRFPSGRTIGPHIGDVFQLLWHHRGAEYPSSSQWVRVLPFIRSAMEAGELDPSFLCMFDDLSDHQAGRPMRYGALLYYYSSLPDALYFVDREQLRRNRASVGWGPADDFMTVMGVDPSLVRYATP